MAERNNHNPESEREVSADYADMLDEASKLRDGEETTRVTDIDQARAMAKASYADETIAAGMNRRIANLESGRIDHPDEVNSVAIGRLKSGLAQARRDAEEVAERARKGYKTDGS